MPARIQNDTGDGGYSHGDIVIDEAEAEGARPLQSSVQGSRVVLPGTVAGVECRAVGVKRPHLAFQRVRENGTSTRSERRRKSYTYGGNEGGLRRIARLDNAQRVTTVKNSDVSPQACFFALTGRENIHRVGPMVAELHPTEIVGSQWLRRRPGKKRKI